MKLLPVISLILLSCLSQRTVSGSCVICAEFLKTPETWEQALVLLKFGCARLHGRAGKACKAIFENAELDESYPYMYPHIDKLRKMICAKYCRPVENSTTTTAPLNSTDSTNTTFSS